MATGIQTGMRSRRSGFAQQQPEKTNYIQKASAFWGGLTKKTKLIGIGSILLMICLAGATHNSVSSNQFVDLYPIKMNIGDVQDVSMELTMAQIEHNVAPTQDGIQLHPKDKTRAQALLAAAGLPQFKPSGADNRNSATTTRDMRIEQQRLKLEGDIAQTLRAMNGIRQARVKIALPPRTYFKDKSLSVKASVFLTLSPGFEVSQSMAQGIGSLVAHSVPELQRENVSIHDSKGERIQVEPAPESMHMKVQMERQRALQSELQTALNHIYGDRAYAVVNLSLDFSHEEIRRYTPGGVGDDGVVKDSSQVQIESLRNTGEKGEDGKDYEERKEAVNWKVRENYYARLRQYAEVERITATVLVDGAADSEVESIKDLVRGSIGIDDGRADQVYVNTLPWQNPDIAVEPEPLPAPAQVQEENTSVAAWAAMAGMFGLACGLSAAFLTSRTKPFFANASTPGGVESPHGIVDHNTNKSGASQNSSDETLHGTRMEALEKLVKAEPGKSAALLKTWMN